MLTPNRLINAQRTTSPFLLPCKPAGYKVTLGRYIEAGSEI